VNGIFSIDLLLLLLLLLHVVNEHGTQIIDGDGAWMAGRRSSSTCR
jgi:hypothetical protein